MTQTLPALASVPQNKTTSFAERPGNAIVKPVHDRHFGPLVDYDTTPSAATYELFTAIDSTGRGQIIWREFEEFLVQQQKHSCGEQDESLIDEIRFLWNESDADKSGSLNRKQFCVVLQAVSELEWVQKHDPNTGRPYYYDHVTNETRWTHPDTAYAVDIFLWRNGIMPINAAAVAPPQRRLHTSMTQPAAAAAASARAFDDELAVVAPIPTARAPPGVALLESARAVGSQQQFDWSDEDESDEDESDEGGSYQDYDDNYDDDEARYDQRHDVEATTDVAATRAMQESNSFSVQRWLSETPIGEEETIQTAHHSFLQRNADFQLTEAALGDEGVHSSMRKIQVKSIGKARQPFVNDGERARE